MAINYHIASFQNSRNKIRAATSQLNEYAGSATTVVSTALAANANRSSATFRNTHATENIYVRTADNTNVVSLGMEVKAGESYEIDSPEIVYVQTSSGTATYRIAEGEG